MIDVYRQGRTGNLLEKLGPVLCVEFGETVVRAIFDGVDLDYRYIHLKRRGLPGFAPEDKFRILSAGEEEVRQGLKSDVGIFTDPGGDIFLELSQKAGLGRKFGDGMPTFPIEEISDQPQGLLARGIDTLILPNLFVIEEERVARTSWGLSNVDSEWSS